MTCDQIDRHIQEIWQDTTAFWDDEISAKFNKAVVNALLQQLSELNTACMSLEMASQDVQTTLQSYERALSALRRR